ncbi:hypothetical protein [uncultured Thiodictyon sp.]|jgi:hypothetical protein|uniref:hypothetical protein n=1 Tax=uncultured Thiodictyon sp. TaxID=1846217 RepID=UPI0025ED50EB|nr:hypothetical protein [uncultured Thiodictyon sp.]
MTSALERFARETLGCNCAPAVFQQVAEDLVPLPGLDAPVRRIAIGGRLLIYLIPLTAPALAVARIGDWAAAGLAERDRRGMNRVRLVLGLADATPAATAPIASAFAQLTVRHERLHLHLLPAAALHYECGTRNPTA